MVAVTWCSLLDNEIAERIVKGSFILSVGQFVSVIVGYLFSVLVANLLGRENYGLLSIALTYPSMIASLVDLGLSGVITRYVAKPGSNKDVYAWTGLMLRSITSFMGGLVVYSLADYFASLLRRPILVEPLRILSIYTVFTSLLGVLAAVFSGLGKYEVSASINIVQYIVRGPLAILFILLGLGINGAALAYSIGYAVVTTLYMILFVSMFKHPVFSLLAAEKMISVSWPLFLASLSSVFLKPVVDTIISRNVLESDLGDYGAALNSLMPLGILLGAISTAIFTSLPILIEDKIQLRESAKDAAFYSSTISTALGFCYLSVIYPLVRIYGRSFVNAPFYAIIYGLSNILPVLLGSLVVGNYFIILKTTKYNVAANIPGFFTIIALSYVLVPLRGIFGSGLAYIAGNIVSSIIAYVIARRKLGLTLDLSRNIRAFIPSLIAFGIGFSASAIITIYVSSLATIYYLLGLLIATMVGLTTYSATYLLILPFFTDKETIRNLINMASSLEYVGDIIKFIGTKYLDFVTGKFNK